MFAGTIPPDTDILLTHGPPKNHLDTSDAKGCPHLAKEIWRCRQSLKLVVFGHIHEGYGREQLPFDRVQQLREGILLGTRGLLALFELAVVILVTRLMAVFRFTGEEKLCERVGITLVNAAIAKRPWERGSRAPVVVEI